MVIAALRDEDLALLDLFRSSHYPALREVQDRIVRLFHKKLRGDPETVPITARPLKTPEAITAKLVREKTRLAVIQDIAGTRIVVPTLELQERTADVILSWFSGWQPRIAKDAGDPDEHGYRALHVVVTTNHPGVGERFAEIQVRTRTQEAWAQVVETPDETFGWDLKHGRGPAEWLQWLHDLSEAFVADERGEQVSLPKMPDPPKR